MGPPRGRALASLARACAHLAERYPDAVRATSFQAHTRLRSHPIRGSKARAFERTGLAVRPAGTRDTTRLSSWARGWKVNMNPSIHKRQKERERQDHQRAKAELRRQRRESKSPKAPDAPGEDPDIAGIVPGPQAPVEE
jgi:hypothetical protein